MSDFFHAVLTGCRLILLLSMSIEAMLPMPMLLMTAVFAAVMSLHLDNYQKYWVLKKVRNFSYYFSSNFNPVLLKFCVYLIKLVLKFIDFVIFCIVITDFLSLNSDQLLVLRLAHFFLLFYIFINGRLIRKI